MAKLSSTSTTIRLKKKITRPGVHAKNRASNSKTSKHYKKAYRGQGK
jgi:hypothetical protein|tara:strand:+ start:4665 stop:4805 length:141 start_codon:yes stop_codon:yes gene_type:complete